MFFLALQSLWLGSAASACVVFEPMEPTDISQADAVFIGELTKYKPIEREGKPITVPHNEPIYARAILTYRVDEILNGDLPTEIEVIWHNWTFGIPEDAPFSGSQIVALERAPSREGKSAFFMFQPPCTSPFQFVASAQNRQVIERLLANEDATLDQDEAIALMQPAPDPITQPAGEVESDQTDTSWAVLGVFALFGLLAAMGLVWRSKSRRS
ncbi:MAG: hypothetical protein AAF697_13455 [Pseudomonadota bacterium]